MRKTVLALFGTRPEAIKMAPLIAAMKKESVFNTLVCVSAQHRQMLDQVLDVFGIVPDYDMDIMRQRQTLTDITTRTLAGMEKVLLEAQPDMVVVHGDTTTTFAGALAAFYRRIPVAHVEAGLRTFDKYSPYPEEINRCLASVLCSYSF
jgi:UDP-N-acetylglucosamine 2-epimerase (non-hydrolysing)